jgi:NhaA family Na+:H+ antiporter
MNDSGQQTSSPRGTRLVSAVREFIRLESAGGILLMISSVAALIIANSPWSVYYDAFLNITGSLRIEDFEVTKPLLLWVNDLWMAVFFFLIGLEIKREIVEGELSSISQVVLPGLGALGGMLVPALIYVALNYQSETALNGWAIPVATDIAFALALLSVFGARVPVALKIFLLSLAIFDDLAAIVIIALFYSADLSVAALVFGAFALAIAVLMNRRGVTSKSAYVLLGAAMWVAVLKSGVHATLAGVLIAFCVPMRDAKGGSPLRELEHDLHKPVALVILPMFAFANAGLSLRGLSLEDVTESVTLGIELGLVLGKPIGIMGAVALAVLLKLAQLPKGVTWTQLLGVSFACGIGFTMSLFIAGLAFERTGGDLLSADRLGILVGSLLSAFLAWLVLNFSLPKSAAEPAAN